MSCGPFLILSSLRQAARVTGIRKVEILTQPASPGPIGDCSAPAAVIDLPGVLKSQQLRCSSVRAQVRMGVTARRSDIDRNRTELTMSNSLLGDDGLREGHDSGRGAP